MLLKDCFCRTSVVFNINLELSMIGYINDRIRRRFHLFLVQKELNSTLVTAFQNNHTLNMEIYVHRLFRWWWGTSSMCGILINFHTVNAAKWKSCSWNILQTAVSSSEWKLNGVPVLTHDVRIHFQCHITIMKKEHTFQHRSKPLPRSHCCKFWAEREP